MLEAKPRLLILGGTGEAAALAAAVAPLGHYQVISSLAGLTRRPAALRGEVRSGGFGGAAGLLDYLRAQRIARVVDATHPFAAAISGHAIRACGQAGVALLRLERPQWRAGEGDTWLEVADAAEAARELDGQFRRIFLTIGRKDLDYFRALGDIWFLVRMIEPPAAPLALPNHSLLLARGPFDTEAELGLLKAHGIEALVAKNSGGTATYAKLEAARRLGLPVLMIARPPVPAAPATARDVKGALAWLQRY